MCIPKLITLGNYYRNIKPLMVQWLIVRALERGPLDQIWHGDPSVLAEKAVYSAC